MAAVFHDVKGAGVLDFVTAWYIKAAAYMADNPAIKTAFVSTNSITQGEQVGILWSELLRQGVKIHFAHRTFQWNNEARGNAAVHCIIVGLALHDATRKRIFDYDTLKSEPHEIAAANINPYLVDAAEAFLERRSSPLCDVPPMLYGSKPVDNGNYLFSDDELREFLSLEPDAKKFVRKFIGSEEFINSIPRWCLWLKNANPADIQKLPKLKQKIEAVRQFRLKSSKLPTQKLAETPTLFAEDRNKEVDYIAVPEVSSENRKYIPTGFIDKNTVASNLLYMIPKAGLFHFGVINSAMHMAWVRTTCGRLKSDYRYSAGIVYNNFPWPEPAAAQKDSIEKAAQGVLDARANHPGASLADLYDPNTMPPDLVKAHRALDAAVDAAYSKKKFTGDADRVAHLFELYQKLTAPLAAEAKKPKKKKAKNK